MGRSLYIKDNAGHLRYWKIAPTFDGLEIEYGVVGGSPQFQYETITEGKQSRDVDEQINSRMLSRVNKQLDKGYVFDKEQAANMRPVNALGFVKPMLAKKSEDVDLKKLLTRDVYYQHKLDGNRCLIHNDGTGLVAYTRNGKEFTTLKHITDQLKGILPADYTFDGELYCHGVPLQTIVSWGKRMQLSTLKLEYHIYDLISDEPFSARYNELGATLRGSKLDLGGSIRLVDTRRIRPDSGPNFEGLPTLVGGSRSLGYEGGMVRSDWALERGVFVPVGYQDGKRSGSLIKCKLWDSAEFEIIGVDTSADGWAILNLRNPRGPNFSVSCPGEVPFKHYVRVHKEKYISKMVTVKFAYWTADNVPFHPTAEAIRDYE